MTSPSDRRQATRIPVAIPVELRDPSGFSLHSSQNLSEGGAYFDRSIPHALGARVQVTLRLPGDPEPIVCHGEVANVPDSKDFGMGVRFLDLRPEDLARLVTFTREQPDGP